MEEQHPKISHDQITFFEPQRIDLPELEVEGFILDIGGGGEGVIGQLKGDQVVAIDLLAGELAEAPPGGLKIVMDARELQFLDETFAGATAFYSLMYLKSRADHVRVFGEVMRVLKPGGQFLIWDVAVPLQSDESKPIYVCQVVVRVGEREIEVGYGQRYPAERRDRDYYLALAEQSGFRMAAEQAMGQSFFLRLQKD